MTDPQLSLIVTERVEQGTQATRVPGVDAVCECARAACGWPFCKPPERCEHCRDRPATHDLAVHFRDNPIRLCELCYGANQATIPKTDPRTQCRHASCS